MYLYTLDIYIIYNLYSNLLIHSNGFETFIQITSSLRLAGEHRSHHIHATDPPCMSA